MVIKARIIDSGFFFERPPFKGGGKGVVNMNYETRLLLQPKQGQDF
jgi:hypothetical protein